MMMMMMMMMLMSISPFGPVGYGRPLSGARRIHLLQYQSYDLNSLNAQTITDTGIPDW
jgi:hypothetical protein